MKHAEQPVTEPPEARRLRWIAPIEAVSFLLLLTSMLVRILLDGPDLSGVLGPIHGLIVTVYVVAVVQAQSVLGWGFDTTLRVVMAAVIPFGGFAVSRHLGASR